MIGLDGLDDNRVPAFVYVGDDYAGDVTQHALGHFVARDHTGRLLGRFTIRSRAIACVLDNATGVALANAEAWGRA